MTESRRIALNVAATYARSLYQMVIGLFCGRWALMALGTVDYGLYGVIGGLIVFISFINSSFNAAIVRFYGVSVGAARTSSDKLQAIEECRRWFSVAVVLHVVMPLTVLSVGYPIGEWAVRSFLTIPPERISDCIWVWRFVCLMGFVHMVTCPFSSMYNAKQYIAELTVYTFVTTTLNAVFLYYMVSHPGVWLRAYSFWTCLLSIIPSVIIAVRAVFLFSECRFRLRYICDWHSYRTLCSFVACNVFCDIIYVSRSKGIDVLVNKFFGPCVNAAMTIANTVNGHAISLSGSLRGAFQPAIVQAYGAGELKKMKTYVYRSCRLGLLLSLVFLLPLSIELREVLTLWLSNPPPLAAEFCWCMMLIVIVSQSTSGFNVAVYARGKIALYSFVAGTFDVMALPLAWLLVWLTRWPLTVTGALAIITCFSAGITLLFARRLVGLSIRMWLFKIILPIFMVLLACAPLGYALRYVMDASFVRVILTTMIVEVIFLPGVWLFVLDSAEKEMVKSKLQSIYYKMRK